MAAKALELTEEFPIAVFVGISGGDARITLMDIPCMLDENGPEYYDWVDVCSNLAESGCYNDSSDGDVVVYMTTEAFRPAMAEIAHALVCQLTLGE